MRRGVVLCGQGLFTVYDRVTLGSKEDFYQAAGLSSLHDVRRLSNGSVLRVVRSPRGFNDNVNSRTGVVFLAIKESC